MTVNQKVTYRVLCEPETPVIGIYPEELKMGTQADICTPIFKTLFT